MKTIRNLCALAIALVYFAPAIGLANPCQSNFYDGFNYTDWCYSSEIELYTECQIYCNSGPNEGHGYCSGWDSDVFEPVSGTGYCQCWGCTTAP